MRPALKRRARETHGMTNFGNLVAEDAWEKSVPLQTQQSFPQPKEKFDVDFTKIDELENGQSYRPNSSQPCFVFPQVMDMADVKKINTTQLLRAIKTRSLDLIKRARTARPAERCSQIAGNGEQKGQKYFLSTQKGQKYFLSAIVINRVFRGDLLNITTREVFEVTWAFVVRN